MGLVDISTLPRHNWTGLAQCPPEEPRHGVCHHQGCPDFPKINHISVGKVLDLIRSTGTSMTNFAVNVGAGDGNHLVGPGDDPANQYFWRGAAGVAFERSTSLAGWINKTLAQYNPSVLIDTDLVVPEALPGMFAKHRVPQDLDLLKIDIDSDDCTLLTSAMQLVRPKVISIEINPDIPPPFGFQLRKCRTRKLLEEDHYPHFTLGSLQSCSLATLTTILKPLAYTLLFVDLVNAVYVQEEFVHLFGNVPHDDRAVWEIGYVDHPGYAAFAPVHRPDGIGAKWMDEAVGRADQRAALHAFVLAGARQTARWRSNGYTREDPFVFDFCDDAEKGPCAQYTLWHDGEAVEPWTF